MGDYLLDRYGLAGHGTVSLPGVMKTLRSAIPLEDIEGIPFFEEVLEDLRALPPPKKFSLFYKPRAVLEAVAKTYVQAAKEYYQLWCRHSAADFYDAWAAEKIPALPGHMLTLEGVFPWAPHMFYLNRATLDGSGTSSYEYKDITGLDETTTLSYTLADSAAPLKQSVRNGAMPLKVTAFTNFTQWILDTAGGISLASSTQFTDAAGAQTMSTASEFEWGSLVYASATVEATVAAEYAGVMSALDFDESSLAIGALAVAQKNSVGGVVHCGGEPPCLGFPAVPLRQLFVDASVATVVLESVPDPEGLPGGTGIMQDMIQTGERLRRLGTGLQIQSSPNDTAFIPVDRSGKITAQFTPSFLAINKARDVPYSRAQYTRLNAGVSNSDKLVRQDRTNAIVTLPMPATQVGLPGFKPIYWRSIDVILMNGTPPTIANWVAPVRLYILELMPEARFVRPEKLDVGTDFGDAATVQELEAVVDGIDQATFKDRCLNPDSYAADKPRIDLFPILAFRTYRIEGSVYCIAAVSRRGFVNPLNGAVAAGTDVVYYAPFSRTNSWYDVAQRAQCSDNVSDAYNNNTYWTTTAETYFVKNGINSIWISSRGEDVQTNIVTKPYTTIGAFPAYPGLTETQSTEFLVIGASYPSFGAHQTTANYAAGLLERYLYIWVPCTVLRGVGLAYDGLRFTGRLQFSVAFNKPFLPGSLFDYTSSTSGTVGASGDFVLGNSETRMYAHKSRFDVEWDSCHVGSLERFCTSDGTVVNLPELLSSRDLPEHLYGSGIPPWDDATLTEIRSHDSDGGSLYSHETDSVSSITRALAIERFMPTTARTSPVSGVGVAYLVGLLIGQAVSPYAKPSSGSQSDYREVAFPMWDAVSAYATGLYPLPDGYEWAHASRVIQASDLVTMCGYATVSNMKQVSADLSKYIFGLDVGTGRVCWSLIGSNTGFGAYPSPNRGRAYLYIGSDGRSLGLSANGALSQPYPVPFNLHIIDICPQPSHSFGLLSFVWDGTPYYLPQGSVFDISTALRPLLTAPGSHPGDFRHRTAFVNAETPPIDGYVTVATTALGLWAVRSSSQSENLIRKGNNLLTPSEVDGLTQGACVFFPYRSMTTAFALDLSGPGTYVVPGTGAHINPARNGI